MGFPPNFYNSPNVFTLALVLPPVGDPAEPATRLEPHRFHEKPIRLVFNISLDLFAVFQSKFLGYDLFGLCFFMGLVISFLFCLSY